MIGGHQERVVRIEIQEDDLGDALPSRRVCEAIVQLIRAEDAVVPCISVNDVGELTANDVFDARVGRERKRKISRTHDLSRSLCQVQGHRRAESGEV